MHISTQTICVGQLITKTFIEMAQGHISLSISPFWWFMPTHWKQLKMQQHFQREAKECKLKTNLSYIGFGIYGSLLPPLGLFWQNKFFFLSLCKKHLFWQIKIHFKTSFDQNQKTPPSSHNQIFSPQESSFCNKRVLIKETKYTFTRILKNSQVVADPVALAWIYPPMALSIKTEELVAY